MIPRAHMVCTHTQHTSKMQIFHLHLIKRFSFRVKSIFHSKHSVAHGYTVWEGTNTPRWLHTLAPPTPYESSRTDLARRAPPRGAGLRAGLTPWPPCYGGSHSTSPLEPTCTCGYLLFNLCKIPQELYNTAERGRNCVCVCVCVCVRFP